MMLERIVSQDRVLFGVQAADKPALLGLLARAAADALGLDAASVLAALAAREALGSTGTGNGIALPHARLAGLAEPVCFLARLARPIPYDAVDGGPVDLAVLLLSPPDDPAHLHVLAALSRRLRAAEVVTALRAAADAAALRTALVGA